MLRYLPAALALPFFASLAFAGVTSQPDKVQGKALAEFLGLEQLTPGPLAHAAETSRRGMPVSFEPGHAEHYREALAEVFAALA